MDKIIPCLWYNYDAEEAANFYVTLLPDSQIDHVVRSPANTPSNKEGDVLVVEFTVVGIPCIGLNGGPAFKHNESFSFQIGTDDQAETDRYWNAIVGNGGAESQCGWCKDRWGVSWQITPRVLTVEFTVMGIPCLGLNGGPAFKHTEAFSFQVATADQAETDRYWTAIVGNGGQESACGWCKDKWGLSWQITPAALMDALTDPNPAAARRAFDAMMQMSKIDIAAIEAARRG